MRNWNDVHSDYVVLLNSKFTLEPFIETLSVLADIWKCPPPSEMKLQELNWFTPNLKPIANIIIQDEKIEMSVFELGVQDRCFFMRLPYNTTDSVFNNVFASFLYVVNQQFQKLALEQSLKTTLRVATGKQ